LTFGVVFDFAFDFLQFPCVDAFAARQKMEKEEPLFERSEFRIFPFFDLQQRGPPLGGSDAWVAFFGIPFLATQERYVAVGLPPTGNRK
jgi:hypothetical protein